METVPTIDLGHAFTVSRMGYGAATLDGLDDDEALRTLERVVDAGLTFVDATGAPAEPIRRLLAHRDDVVVAATCGAPGLDAPAVGATGSGARAGAREHVRAACEATLRSLHTEAVDLYVLDARGLDAPIEEAAGAVGELVGEGKVRHLGVAGVTADALDAAAAAHPVTAVAGDWSLWSRRVERDVVHAALEAGAGFVPYDPLGGLRLAGAREPAASEADREAAETLDAVAGAHAATPAQVALAWLYARGEDLGISVAPLPGARSADLAIENTHALRLLLAPDEMARLDRIAGLVGDDARPRPQE